MNLNCHFLLRKAAILVNWSWWFSNCWGNGLSAVKSVWCKVQFEQGCLWVALTGNGSIFCGSVEQPNKHIQPSLTQEMAFGLQDIPKPWDWVRNCFFLHLWAQSLFSASCIFRIIHSSLQLMFLPVMPWFVCKPDKLELYKPHHISVFNEISSRQPFAN